MFGICQLLILGNFNNAIVESQKFLGNLGMKRKRNEHPCNSQRYHVAAFPQEGRGPTGEQGRPRGACHGSVGSVSCPRGAGGELEASGPCVSTDTTQGWQGVEEEREGRALQEGRTR